MDKNLFLKELSEKDKEIRKLKKENFYLREKLELIENYRIEYESLIKKLKQTQKDYEKKMDIFNNLENEYRTQLEFMLNDSK